MVVVIGMGVQVGLWLISCFYVFVMNLFRINFSLNELKKDRMKRERGNIWLRTKSDVP